MPFSAHLNFGLPCLLAGGVLGFKFFSNVILCMAPLLLIFFFYSFYLHLSVKFGELYDCFFLFLCVPFFFSLFMFSVCSFIWLFTSLYIFSLVFSLFMYVVSHFSIFS